MAQSLGDLMPDAGTDSAPTLGGSLSDLWNATVVKVAQSAANSVTGSVDEALNKQRSTQTMPVPDLVASVAAPGSTFIRSSVAGISIPVLLAGAGAVLYIVLRRRR